MIEKVCKICGNTFQGEDYHELRKFFSPSKQTKDNLETRCRKCKKEIAKKYRVSKVGDNTYKDTHEKRKTENSYISNNVKHMSNEDINNAIVLMEKRLQELKNELNSR